MLGSDLARRGHLAPRRDRAAVPRAEELSSNRCQAARATVVEAFLYASFLTLRASRSLLLAARQWGAWERRRTPPGTLGATLRQRRSGPVGSVARSPAYGPGPRRPLLLFLLAEAPDPNRTCELLPEPTELKWAA
jgi:hypothetical protein